MTNDTSTDNTAGPQEAAIPQSTTTFDTTVAGTQATPPETVAVNTAATAPETATPITFVAAPPGMPTLVSPQTPLAAAPAPVTINNPDTAHNALASADVRLEAAEKHIEKYIDNLGADFMKEFRALLADARSDLTMVKSALLNFI